jgi:glutathione S-transferase
MDHRFEALGYRVQLTEDEGVWVATARRLDTGDMFGPPVPADRAEEAADQLARWLEWQQAHTAALQALQVAESAYHRLSADRFSSAGDADRAALRAALADIDDRRRQLDDVRAGRPWPH